MELIVRHRGEDREVTVDRRGDLYRVTVGGTTYEVDLAAAGDGVRSLVIAGAQHEVAIHRQADGRYWVSTASGSGPVEITDPLTYLAEKAHLAAGPAGPQRVTAYMPGRVVAVLVEEGAEVAAGQGVVVLSAMKMENEIQSEHAGTVHKIFVEAGQAVEGGDPLFEVG